MQFNGKRYDEEIDDGEANIEEIHKEQRYYAKGHAYPRSVSLDLEMVEWNLPNNFDVLIRCSYISLSPQYESKTG